jgi:hypothetical protein
MPTARDKIRLQRGDDALRQPVTTSWLRSLTDEQLGVLREEMWDAVGAMQSLDDLGSDEANQRAWADMQRILRKANMVDAEIQRRVNNDG